MRKRSQFLFLAACALIPSLGVAGPSLLDNLSKSDIENVRGGKQILITEDMDGKPWPRVNVYKRVDAKPEEVIAVFCDYRNAKTFVPNVLKSDISKEINGQVCEVDYGVDVPILPDEYYTVRNTIQVMGNEKYQVSWKLVRAMQTKDSEGFIRVEPFEDGSVILYQNLVTPGSSMAGLLRGKAIEQMRQTVTAITEHVEKKKSDSPNELKKTVEAFRSKVATATKQ
jgi:hypothetical protein